MLRARTRSLYQSLVTVSRGSVLTDGAFYFLLLGGGGKFKKGKKQLSVMGMSLRIGLVIGYFH